MIKKLKHIYAFIVEYAPEPFGAILETAIFLRRGTIAAPPKYVRKMMFKRYFSDLDLIYESGTYLGKSTRIFSNLSPKVVTVEPDENLVARANKKFKKCSSVCVVQGFSEQVLERVISAEIRDGVKSAGFWLDGHASDDNVAMDTGVAPLIEELRSIRRCLSGGLEKAVILIDDVRYTTPLMSRNEGYPELDLIYEELRGMQCKYLVHMNILIAVTSKRKPS